MTDPPRREPDSELMSRLIALGNEYGLTPQQIEMWLDTPSTYFLDEGTPRSHLDDPELVLEVADRDWGVVW